MTIYGGLDIGGTKCAIALGQGQGSSMTILDRMQFPTPSGVSATMEALIRGLRELTGAHGVTVDSVGISCGGPLDTHRGRLLSPPNLPGWDDVDVVGPVQSAFGVPVRLENDANAGALAEWRWGKGRGVRNLVFLTFGTGMGAGLILNGSLYRGTADLAGEIGHLRLANHGPMGFGKFGSFEGFCSGGGIAQLAAMRAKEWMGQGKQTSLATPNDAVLTIPADKVGMAAAQGDALARAVFGEVGQWLGRGLAVLVDLLNPEMIVMGGIYSRQRSLMEPSMRKVVESEAIPGAYQQCQIEASSFGEAIGDYAAMAAARDALISVDDRYVSEY